MKRDVYWFSHDANARRDQKMIMMRHVYGAEGYGWFWMLIEMMRETEDHRLKLTGKYTMTALAKELDSNCNANALQKYIEDCIEEFELFETDGEYFWSPALCRRMVKYHETVDKRREAASKRWNKDQEQSKVNTNAMQMHTTCNANAEQEQCTSNAIRGEEIRGDKIIGEDRIGEERTGEGCRGGPEFVLTDELRKRAEESFGDSLSYYDEKEKEVLITSQAKLMFAKQQANLLQ